MGEFIIDHLLKRNLEQCCTVTCYNFQLDTSFMLSKESRYAADNIFILISTSEKILSQSF